MEEIRNKKKTEQLQKVIADKSTFMKACFKQNSLQALFQDKLSPAFSVIYIKITEMYVHEFQNSFAF
jgi:hypothetical protein